MADVGMTKQYAQYFVEHPFPRLTRPGELIPPLEEVDDDDDEGGPGGWRGGR